MTYDVIKKTKTFNGNVILTRNTLTIKASKAILTTNSTGHEFAILYAAPSKFVSFRQKQNNKSNIWIEGQAKRIEYNQSTQTLKLFSKAYIKFIDGNKIINEINGEFISYNNRTKFYLINNYEIYQKKT